MRCSLLVLLCLAVCACSASRKAKSVRSGAFVPVLTLADESSAPEMPSDSARAEIMTVKGEDGKDLTIMNAVKDENGEMVASDVIKTSIVVAASRNIAERNGFVDLHFDINVPSDLTDSRWQLRLFPVMNILDSREELDPIFITGAHYRDVQLRGYERYERFVNKIITDSLSFVNVRDLEVFLKRNYPELYAFKNDSSIVSDQVWEAMEHYTDHFRKRRNSRREGRKEEMFHRYVKSPIRTEALRLDSVVVANTGDITYGYVQTIKTRPGLRKVEIELNGSVYEEDRKMCSLPQGGKLTFYISSLSSFVDGTERYLDIIVERRVKVDNSCRIDFEKGKSVIRENLGSNASEMGRIKNNIKEILENSKFDLDSVVITAYASPDGSARLNDALAFRRASAASEFFSEYTRSVTDSLPSGSCLPQVKFLSRNGGENWTLLTSMLECDSLLAASDKALYADACRLKDLDAREKALQKAGGYKYIKEEIYPKLRTVKFDFHLHRKGVVKDTVHTSVLDSVYMKGVQAIRDRDYETAMALLAPYRDYNAALACISTDRNHSALEILKTLDKSPRVDYMTAIVQSRFGNDRAAVQHYLDACRADRSYIFRGSLDPEISALIRKYKLNIYEN